MKLFLSKAGHATPWRAVLAMFILALAPLMHGCTSTQPYRTLGKTCEVDNPPQDAQGNYAWEARSNEGRSCADAWQVTVDKPQRFTMNFVEIDEQGILASRAQAEAAITNASLAEPGGSYVVVFVHGWHHNAGTDDTNVQHFYDALASVSRWNPSRKVKGIYIGWRGDSLAVHGLRYATFWDRKNTSDEVGRGGLLEFLLRLERGVKGNAKADNRLVVVGHSFGASVTFNALAHTYLERFLDGVYSNADGPRFRGYGDLVVLVNPAIEAMRYMPFQSALEYYSRPDAQPRVDFSHETMPRLVVLSSENDTPTRHFFPAARFLSTLFEAHVTVSATNSPDKAGDYSEWNMDRDTVGNYKHFQTHFPVHLIAAANVPRDEAKESRAAVLFEDCKARPAGEVRRLLNLRPTDAGDDDAQGAFPHSGMRVRRMPKTTAGSPYIVAGVGSEIVNGHTDIGRPNLVCWINQLLDTKESEERPLRSEREPPVQAASVLVGDKTVSAGEGVALPARR
jgi:pimeloyl-ACP methyl ester carboxylesterase